MSIEALPRSVSEMPRRAPTAVAAVTPGMTSKATPADRTALISSPKRPNTAGSPPFNRTMRSRRRAQSTRSQLMCP